MLDDEVVNHIPSPEKASGCQQDMIPFLVAVWLQPHIVSPPMVFFQGAQVVWGKLCKSLIPQLGAHTSHHLTKAHVGGYLSGHFCAETEKSQLLPHTKSLENISSLLPINYLEGDMLQLIA